MGAGIAQVAAVAGNTVNLIDINDQVLVKAKAGISKSLERVVKSKFKDDPSKGAGFVEKAMKNINFTTDMGAAKSTELVVEAVIENIELKRKIFKDLETITPASTILASNTSSLQISDIAVNSGRKDKFAGLHFFNPVPMMKLVEVISMNETSKDTYEKLMKWSKDLGKVPVTCKDTPGFIVNRLLVPNLVQAILMVERGDANMKDVDIAMKLGAGYPMGPFELADFVGLDVILFIVEGWVKNYPNEGSFVVPALLKKIVSEGKLGKKSGEGFYKYN
jgi:3-hydroxyacyl-CoA dehydrogenase